MLSLQRRVGGVALPGNIRAHFAVADEAIGFRILKGEMPVNLGVGVGA